MSARQVVRVMRLRRRVTALEDALRALTDALPWHSPTAGDTRCAFCGERGSKHAAACPWTRARALLDTAPDA